MAAKSILLIGGAGYLGTVITDSLLNAGYKVTCLDNFLFDNNNQIVPYLLNPNYRFVHGDMSNNDDLGRALHGVTDVVLLAGLVGDPITKNYPDVGHKINNLDTVKCIDLLNNRGLESLIFISSCSNYGLQPRGKLATETSELKPASLYAKAKIEMEEYIMSLKGRVDYVPTVLRFATAFGLSPRMRFDLTVNELVYGSIVKKELLIFNPGAWRPYCHVKDFARVIDIVINANRDKKSFEVFNAGGDINNYTKQGLVDMILNYLPDTKITVQDKTADPRDYCVDFTKIKTLLNFEPRYTVNDGIVEILNAFDQHIYARSELEIALNPNAYGNIKLKTVE